MVIEQTVEIPASRRLFIDVPPEVPVGWTKLRYEPFVPRELRADAAARPVSRELPADETREERAARRRQELLAPKAFDPIKAEAARKALCGMYKTDGHDVERFLAEKDQELERELEIEREREENSRRWHKH